MQTNHHDAGAQMTNSCSESDRNFETAPYNSRRFASADRASTQFLKRVHFRKEMRRIVIVINERLIMGNALLTP